MAREYAPNRIKELRKARGLTLEDVAAGVRPESTASTIAKLENRRMGASLDYIVEIARVLEVEPAELMGKFSTGFRFVPLVGAIAAGNWQEAVEKSDDAVPVPASLEGKRLFALHPDGDSMDLLVPAGAEGGFIVVDPDQRDLIDRKFYAVMNEAGETTFKRFCANPLSLLPCSSNPDHQPIPLGSQPFTVLGRVVFVGQEL